MHNTTMTATPIKRPTMKEIMKENNPKPLDGQKGMK